MQTARFWCLLGQRANNISPDKGDLRDYWIGISYARDFLGTAPSYTAIRDPVLRLCHRLIACSIARRSQAPEKVTVTDLFYLRGMDVDSVNVPYLLARYLRLFSTEGIAGLYFYFIIDMIELVRLQICVQLDDTWVGSHDSKRQPDAAAEPLQSLKDAPFANEGDH
ncbi:hypothetical protein Tco_0955393 [Tanacetum coccineum]|uniref:Uncharacterized protein n=1 Tax=Tanacetum coccineum TaxID=301880 RepID=A0ABQ5E731_9ASTR